jgi:hypothetical protein
MRDLLGRHQAPSQRFVDLYVPPITEQFPAATPCRLVQLECDVPAVGLNNAAAVFVSQESGEAQAPALASYQSIFAPNLWLFHPSPDMR